MQVCLLRKNFLDSAVEKKAMDKKKKYRWQEREKEQIENLYGEAVLSWKETLEIIAWGCQEPCLTWFLVNTGYLCSSLKCESNSMQQMFLQIRGRPVCTGTETCLPFQLSGRQRLLPSAPRVDKGRMEPFSILKRELTRQTAISSLKWEKI